MSKRVGLTWVMFGQLGFILKSCKCEVLVTTYDLEMIQTLEDLEENKEDYGRNQFEG